MFELRRDWCSDEPSRELRLLRRRAFRLLRRDLGRQTVLPLGDFRRGGPLRFLWRPLRHRGKNLQNTNRIHIASTIPKDVISNIGRRLRVFLGFDSKERENEKHRKNRILYWFFMFLCSLRNLYRVCSNRSAPSLSRYLEKRTDENTPLKVLKKDTLWLPSRTLSKSDSKI